MKILPYNSITGRKFFFRGCGWAIKKAPADWSEEQVLWLKVMDNLFNEMFSKDFNKFSFTETLVCVVAEEDQPLLRYNHSEWEKVFLSKLAGSKVCLEKPSSKPKEAGKPPIKSLFKKKVCLENTQNKKIKFYSLQDSKSIPALGHPKHQDKLKNMSNYELHADYIKLCQSRKATREELVNICLPKVDPNLQVEDVAPVFGEFVTQNPFVLKSRPSESVTTAALNTLSTCHNLTTPFDDNCIVINEKNDPTGVALGELGTFDADSINVFKTFCDISEMQKNYQFEMAWLQRQCSGHSVEDITLVEQFLKKSPLNNSNVIVLQEDLFVDFKSVTSLIGERWVDNFVINFFLKKFIAFDCEQHKEKVIASLPTEAFNWIESKERNVD